MKRKMAKLLDKLRGLGRNRAVSEIKSFRENQLRESAFDYRDRGIQTVQVSRIVGSVGRYHDFDGTFGLKKHMPAERLEGIKTAMRTGKQLPPVSLYQIKNDYFAVDGNHRIAAAKELGRSEIDAKIIEFIPSGETLDNIIYRERVEFEEHTRLREAINVTEIGQYAYLEKQIERHRTFLEKETRASISFEDAALDWYESIYRKLATLIEKGRLVGHFRGRTVADLYVYISYHQWDEKIAREYGIGINRLVPPDMEEFREKMAGLKESEYPEMKRVITAFVTLNVKGNKEFKIVEKLYALHEIRELHSVHGDVDIIAKIVLKRDLLSSDAEIIGHFVHNEIRQIPGVISTRTLIPSISKIKTDEE